jgi:hypothetical protein
MKNVLTPLIDAQHERIATIQGQIEAKKRELDAAYIKLDAFMDAQAALENGPVPAVNLASATLQAPQRRRRALSPEWNKVLTHIDLMGSVSLDEIHKTIGADRERRLVRQQMRYYKEQGFVTVLDDKYDITELGKSVISGK